MERAFEDKADNDLDCNKKKLKCGSKLIISV